MDRIRSKSSTAVLFAVALAACPVASWASHSGIYHWERASNPFTLELGDNVSSTWDPHLLIAAYDWSLSTVLDTVVVAGTSKSCRPTSGRVEVCNAYYGHTGWLAIHQLWVSGLHITQATIKLNDTYLDNPPYNTSASRQYFLCRYVGLTLGLTAQNSEDGSCMGDTALYEHPNEHDYEQLETLYAHLDLPLVASAQQATPLALSGMDLSEPARWGRRSKASRDGRIALYELDLGAGHKVLTTVVWAERD